MSKVKRIKVKATNIRQDDLMIVKGASISRAAFGRVIEIKDAIHPNQLNVQFENCDYSNGEPDPTLFNANYIKDGNYYVIRYYKDEL